MSLRALAGLGLDHHPRVEDDRAGDQRRRADLVGAADAPGGEQRDRQPEQVDQRREPVALEEDDRGAVDQLRALRVEPGGEPQRVGEVEVDGRALPGRSAPRRACGTRWCRRRTCPWSRLSCDGKVHSATVKEATAERRSAGRSSAPAAARSPRPSGRRHRAGRARRREQADGDADDDDPADVAGCSACRAARARRPAARPRASTSASRASAPENSGTIQRRSQ